MRSWQRRQQSLTQRWATVVTSRRALHEVIFSLWSRAECCSCSTRSPVPFRHVAYDACNLLGFTSAYIYSRIKAAFINILFDNNKSRDEKVSSVDDSATSQLLNLHFCAEVSHCVSSLFWSDKPKQCTGRFIKRKSCGQLLSAHKLKQAGFTLRVPSEVADSQSKPTASS